MKRANPRQYSQMQKFCRDLFRKTDFISERSLNLAIQNNLSPYATRFRKYLLQLNLLREKNRLYYAGPDLRYFKAKDFYAIRQLRPYGHVSLIGMEIHFHSRHRNPKITVPENWEVCSKSNYKIVFKIKESCR